MAINPKYNETTSYNKHLDCDFKSVSPCPPGLVAVYDCDGNHSACLSPNDAEVYKNSTLKIAEGYAKVYHPVTGEYLGAMCVTEACELLTCLNSDFSVRDYISGVVLDGTDLIFTGVGDAFAGTIDLGALTGSNDIDYINAATLNGTILDLTGVGNAGASVELGPLVTTDTNDIDYISNVAIVNNDITFTGVGNAFSGVISIPEAGAIADLNTYQTDVTITTEDATSAITGSAITNVPAGRYLACATINMQATQTAATIDTNVGFGIYNNGIISPGSQMQYWVQRTQHASVYFRENHCYSVQVPIDVADLDTVDLRADVTVTADGMVLTSELNLTLIKIG
jgi:hypothetical protein